MCAITGRNFPNLTCLALTLAWLTVVSASAAKAAEALPNIVYILADDLGYGDAP